ncbi:response regulator transcription factor [Burkholderia latens]|uniref:Response regulator transcription factor n=1 Tax=Burkholderia latens TaxID=488446 RepID=A0A6H9SVL3_9BURK|nr:response regulator transcription factor [Burkholderia latens]KAB0644788.1 response regulator transcription factor [Burkholderia latens]VWB17511.1 two component transcriptional regulator [Burkholderia latens]
MNILLIENDVPHAKLMQQFMASEELTILHATSAEGGVEIAKRHPVDLLVLEWQPYAAAGLQLIETIRSYSGKRVPVICLSNQVAEMEIVGQPSGVIDDYILRPFSGLELAARIDAWLQPGRRTDAAARDMTIGDFILKPSERRVMLHGGAIHLMPKEYELMAFFFRNVGKIVSRQILSMAVWGRTQNADSRTLDTHIYRLRKKHGMIPENGVRLESVYTRGYRLEAVGAYGDLGVHVVPEKIHSGGVAMI